MCGENELMFKIYKHENLHNENERVKQIKDKLKEIEKNNSEKFEEIEKQFAKKIEALVNELKQTKKVIVEKDDKITKLEKVWKQQQVNVTY